MPVEPSAVVTAAEATGGAEAPLDSSFAPPGVEHAASPTSSASDEERC
jgi:hypothetical protein